MNEISVNELEQKIAECFEQQAKYEEVKEKASEEYSKLEVMKEKIISTLESLEMDKYNGKAGSFSYRYEENFQVPKDTDSREKFFSFLKDKNVFDSMISVNSKTLNAFAKAEIQAAEAEGILDYQIPGAIKSAPVARASMRRAK